MFNMLRMDLYRALRSKSIYICLGFLLIPIFLCYGLFYLLITPHGQEMALHMGMLDFSEAMEAAQILEEVDSLEMFRQSSMDGGLYSTAVGIVAAMFVCVDFHYGFVKNILSLYRDRWKYVVSKLIVMGLVNLCYLSVTLVFSLLMNLMLGGMVPFSASEDLLFYFGWVWLTSTAFSSLIIMVCVFTRSATAGALSAVFLGSGIVVSVLHYFTSLFGGNGWINYTLYGSICYGPSHFSNVRDLSVVIAGGLFLTIYSVIAAVAIGKRDI